MEYINGYKARGKFKVLSEKETGFGGKWYLIECGENRFAYGTLADIQSLFFVPVEQYGTKKELKRHCESIIELCKKHINKYEKNIIKDKNNIKAWNIFIEYRKKELEALTDFAEKMS